MNNEPKYYPAQPSLGHRMLLAAIAQGNAESAIHGFVHAALKTVWADERNIEDQDTLVEIANANGLDGAALLSAAAAPEHFAAEQKLTEEALERNVFGAPFYIFNGEPFWGQDRLELLEAAIVEDAKAR